ncbi:MAG TPA: EAL domain-containing protein [Candidatus Polarisedimenticolaceae bacterium]|nr:EAL domain-containing protein [Candidatus Polarisedimenticolaceae bacterium]
MASPRDGAAPSLPPELPRLDDLLASAAPRLAADHEFGLLSVTVLQRRHLSHGADWHAYDALIREIGAFLRSYRTERMRRDDRLFEPSMNGNAFAVMLEPPRKGRALDPGDLARVRARLARGLKVHLARQLPREVGDAFGWYVGAAVIAPEAEIPFERIVHRALEESFADALREKEREGRRHAVQLARVLHLGLVHSVYQPVVDIVDQRVIGFEALTRVGSGRFENVELLFKAAEANDALWALERLCRRKALEDLPTLGPGQLLFLNVEPDSIHDPHLGGPQFLDGLAAVGLSATQVVLELTEHSAVRDFVAFRRTLERFRSLGFRLAMDDVGSGYAGLQSIAEIGPDFIKADMHLVRGLHESPIKRQLIDTIRRFSDSTGITFVAEGVESRDELEALVDVGVRCAQGFLFARPGSPPTSPDWTKMR